MKTFCVFVFRQNHSRQVAWRAREKIPLLVDNTFLKLFADVPRAFAKTARGISQASASIFFLYRVPAVFVWFALLTENRRIKRERYDVTERVVCAVKLWVNVGKKRKHERNKNYSQHMLGRSSSQRNVCWCMCKAPKWEFLFALFLSLSNLQKWNCRVRFWTSLRRRSRFGRENHRPMTSSRFIDNKTTQEKTQRWCHRRCARFVGSWRRLWRTERMKN